jgi:hypothetical protein
MYQAIGVSALLKGYWYLAAACAATLATNAWGLIPILAHVPLNEIAGSVILISLITGLIGQTPIFPWLCRHILWGWFPAIEGTYDVEMASNWSLIEARANGTTPIEFDANTNAFRKVGKMTIKARLLDVHVHLVMDDGYSQSDTIACSVKPAADGGPPHLYYVYRAHVPVPKSTDSESHYGATRIPLPNEKRLNELTGTYWTDRNWHKGLNTAGRLILKKV